MAAELQRVHRGEVDFRAEASHLAAIGANLARHRALARVPSVISSLSTRRVLVMNECAGVRLSDVEALRACGIDRDQLMRRVCDAWVAQLFADGHFHCDPHGGNLLATSAPPFGAVPTILDFGMVRRIAEAERLAFCRMVHAVGERDADAILDAAEALGAKLNRELLADPLALVRGLLWTFRDTEGEEDAAAAAWEREKGERRQARAKYVARRKELVAEASATNAPPPARHFVGGLPPVLVFLLRSIWMIQGLGTSIGGSAPILAPMVERARHELCIAAARDLGDTPPPPPPRPPPSTSLQERMLRLMDALRSIGQLVGAQVCVVHGGRTIVDAALGSFGPATPRPVDAGTLFQAPDARCNPLPSLLLRARDEACRDR